MIRIQVTNNAGRPRTWNVEPYGDEVQLAVDDVLSIEIAHDAGLTFEIVLHPDAEVIWTSTDSPSTRGTTLLPEDLKLNDVSLWPRTGNKDTQR